MAEQEGVIKYVLSHELGPLPAGVDITPLALWREKLMEAGLVGQDPARYDGYGFGNLSMRQGDGFLITGSQTGDVKEMRPRHFALVTEAFPEENRVSSNGETPPSSESLTHAAVYAALPEAMFVFHGHSPQIWRNAEALGLPQTAGVPYGTPEMAREVHRLLQGDGARLQRIFTMSGHEDGVIAFGRTATEAGQTLIETQARAARIEKGTAL